MQLYGPDASATVRLEELAPGQDAVLSWITLDPPESTDAWDAAACLDLVAAFRGLASACELMQRPDGPGRAGAVFVITAAHLAATVAAVQQAVRDSLGETR